MTYYTAGKYFVTGLCTAELLGLWGPSRKGKKIIPSITRVIHATRQKPLGKAIVAGLISWEVYHFLVEKPPVVAIQIIPVSCPPDQAA